MTLIVNSRLQIPKEEFEFTFTRSSGPGGQNVNKVNSKATLRWAPRKNATLPADVIDRFMVQYRPRLTTEDELLISSQRYRDQGRNIEDCLEKLREMVAAVAVPPKKRKPIKITKAAKRRRLENKRKLSDKKQGRSRPRGEE